jgi:hypothetical protein
MQHGQGTADSQFRKLLDKLGVDEFFSGLVFTDAVRQIGTAFSGMVHIGNRDSKDVVGPQIMGMRLILIAGT